MHATRNSDKFYGQARFSRLIHVNSTMVRNAQLPCWVGLAKLHVTPVNLISRVPAIRGAKHLVVFVGVIQGMALLFFKKIVQI